MMIATFISYRKRAFSNVLEGMALKILSGGKPPDPHLSPVPLLHYSCFFNAIVGLRSQRSNRIYMDNLHPA